MESLAAGERELTAGLVAHLAEVEHRRLYLGLGFPSLHAYCTTVLKLSDDAAFARIRAARALRKFPEIQDALSEGSLSLTAVRLLSAHLTPENGPTLLTEAREKSTREVERLIARRFPVEAIPFRIRKLPRRRRAGESERDSPSLQPPTDPGSSPGMADLCDSACPVARDSLEHVPRPVQQVQTRASAPPETAEVVARQVKNPSTGVESQPLSGWVTSPRTTEPRQLAARPVQARRRGRCSISPLSEDLYAVQLTVSASLVAKLEQARDLLGHQIPSGNPVEILERALDLLIERAEKRKFARTDRPRKAPGPHRDAGGRAASAAPADRQRVVTLEGTSRATTCGPEPQSSTRAATRDPVRQESEPRGQSRQGPDSPGDTARCRESSGPDPSLPDSRRVDPRRTDVHRPGSRRPGSRRGDSRHIPAAVRREVWQRDRGRCRFIGEDGRRCEAKGRIEFDHVEPHAAGGAATAENLRMMCRSHNRYLAELWFGRKICRGL